MTLGARPIDIGTKFFTVHPERHHSPARTAAGGTSVCEEMAPFFYNLAIDRGLSVREVRESPALGPRLQIPPLSGQIVCYIFAMTPRLMSWGAAGGDLAERLERAISRSKGQAPSMIEAHTAEEHPPSEISVNSWVCGAECKSNEGYRCTQGVGSRRNEWNSASLLLCRICCPHLRNKTRNSPQQLNS
jgi:hypothetical protein